MDPHVTSSAERTRRTRGHIHLMDAIAGGVITSGGIGVLVAVLGMCLYLAAAVLPLFERGKLESATRIQTSLRDAPVLICADEHQKLVLTLAFDGMARVCELATGKVLDERPILATSSRVSSFAWESTDGLLGVGYEDGTVQLGTIGFASEQVAAADLTKTEQGLEIGQSVPYKREGSASRPGGVLERQGADQYRVIFPTISMREPAALDSGSGAVVRLDYRKSSDRELLVAMRADGTTLFEHVTTTTPLDGGAAKTSLESRAIAYAAPAGRGTPDSLFVTGDSADVLAMWNDGVCQRYSLEGEDSTPAALAETVSLLESGRSVRSTTMMIGGLTVLLGDDAGRVSGCFAARQPESGTRDGRHMVRAHTLSVAEAPITHLAVSQRNRSFLASDERGGIYVWNLTAHKHIVSAGALLGQSVLGAAIAPKFDGLVALASNGTLATWRMNAGHPEASWSSLFGKIHYEGEPGPNFSYQSSAASDSSEPKLSLRPLIHGSLKATLIAMFIAIPLSILAAIFTSEFLSPRTRLIIKPAVEMMSSLPSVVLGFIAAIVVAPFLSSVLPSILTGLMLTPLLIVIAAHLWQMLPQHLASRTRGGGRLGAIIVTIVLGAIVSASLGPVIERALFRPTRIDVLLAAGSHRAIRREAAPAWIGTRATLSPDDERHLRAIGLGYRDGHVVEAVEPASSEEIARTRGIVSSKNLAEPSLRRWLDGNIGGAYPGWFMLLLGPAAILIWALQQRLLARALNERLARMDRARSSVLLLGKLALLLALSVLVSHALALGLSAAGLDARDVVLGPYSQRNTLVVGLIMGFAIIPIIYTIAEDAMASVPVSLRTASLGAGATRWQTAIRVVLPVAASGIFSAVMIGLGRAVGETMIVVMATGNTPAMDWNIFSGFRTLSANIAVELPEAAKDSTHYRVLFLCGLVLFAMTFLVNTTAEIIRQHFRRRNAAL